MRFDELSKQYEPMIHKIIHSLHIYKDVDEFYQIGLIALWDAWKGFKAEKGDFSNYAYSFIKGRMLNQLNKERIHAERTVIPKEEYWETAEAPFFDHPLEKEILLSYCISLTIREKKWVVSSFLYSLSIKEMAEKEMVSVSAVKQWRSGAIKKLRLTAKKKEH